MAGEDLFEKFISSLAIPDWPDRIGAEFFDDRELAEVDRFAQLVLARVPMEKYTMHVAVFEVGEGMYYYFDAHGFTSGGTLNHLQKCSGLEPQVGDILEFDMNGMHLLAARRPDLTDQQRRDILLRLKTVYDSGRRIFKGET